MFDLDEIRAAIRKFRDDRDWMQFHNPKNLACSVSIEAAELLQYFQWKTFDESISLANHHRAEIAKEIADIAIYLIELSDNLEIDLGEAVFDKLKENGEKYPVTKAKGVATKYDRL